MQIVWIQTMTHSVWGTKPVSFYFYNVNFKPGIKPEMQ